MDKQFAIAHLSELVHEFNRLLAIEPDFRWSTPADAEGRPGWVDLEFDAKTHRFVPAFLLKPSLPEIRVLSDADNETPSRLLVAPQLSTRILDFCREHRLSAIDLNGRAYIRAEGLLIDRQAIPGRRFHYKLEPRNIFVGKSARIIRTLLTDRDQTWVQNELTIRSKASSGLVSRIVNYLIADGILEKRDARRFTIREPFTLLDSWAETDNLARRARTARYATFGGTLLEQATKLKRLADDNSIRIAFTQWIAGWLRHPYTEPAIVSAYVSHLPADTALELHKIRPVSDAGKIWLHVPNDEGVFLETRQVRGLPIVSDAQIYLDLQSAGLRGPEQAAALRNWKGFCRP